VTSSRPATSSSRSGPGLEVNPFSHPTRSSCADWLLWASNARLSRIPLSPCALSPTSESKHYLRPLMTRRARYRSSITLRLSCIGSAPRTCGINTHTPIAQAFRELRSQGAPGRCTCSWPSPRSEDMALTQSRFADGCDRCSTACSWWPRPDRRQAIQAELSLLDESIANGSPMRLAWRSRARATRKASVRR
jgi:hypothetical protein